MPASVPEVSRRVDPAAPVLGLRAWQVRSNGRLCSVFWPASWSPGTNRADCHEEAELGTGQDHPAPERSCTCGLYGLTNFDGWQEEHFHRPPSVVGVIAAWGLVELEYELFRAEYARILAIGQTRRGSSREGVAARRYGVPLVPFAALETHGQRLVQTLWPASTVEVQVYARGR